MGTLKFQKFKVALNSLPQCTNLRICFLLIEFLCPISREHVRIKPRNQMDVLYFAK